MRVLLSIACIFLFPTCIAWMMTPPDSYFTRFTSEMIVPPKQEHEGTLLLWHGLHPLDDSPNLEPIGLGSLFPTLTWGPSCAPGKQPEDYASWWVSGQYQNFNGKLPWCFGGDTMSVNPGDVLHASLKLVGNVWRQNIKSSAGGSVQYEIDMKGQGQNWAQVVWEMYDQVVKVPTTIHFMNMHLTVAKDFSGYCEGYPVMAEGENCTKFVKNGLDCRCKACDLVIPA